MSRFKASDLMMPVSSEAIMRARVLEINFKSREREKESYDSAHNNPCTPRSACRIMYSNSSGMLKPPPIEQDLQCTLEELCFGCKKQINLTRHVPTSSRDITEEEEALKIKVKPGWKKGTKIKFKGKRMVDLEHTKKTLSIASQRKGTSCLKALISSTISVPLLGGQHMDLMTGDQIV
ncbi:uncharacterized protein LOC129301772 [Prosopis cineraria]|uniref:uncharacterized protein LOC129301772 n=1 Tax=Prosopis cineraria TaxID=364024 RepID=UPI00240ED465|nr:uncharacterized protein LOC129301772 [Prosopis cineraria]